MSGAVPGFVPRMLVDPDVGLFRADERVFTAMLDGWRAQMLARGLATQTIKQRCQLLERFQEFTGEFPWQWRPADVDDFLAGLRSGKKPISLKTLRSYSNAVAMFWSYLTHPGYGWGEFCERTFGDIPSQICFDWNTPRHTTDDAVPAARRAFTKAELQRLFDHIDDLIDREYAAGTKRWLPLFRDSVAFKVCYAYGLRRREMTMLDLEDFGPNPHVSDYGRFGALQVRWAKGTTGSGPRRRTVLTVPEFDWVVDQLGDVDFRRDAGEFRNGGAVIGSLAKRTGCPDVAGRLRGCLRSCTGRRWIAQGTGAALPQAFLCDSFD